MHHLLKRQLKKVNTTVDKDFLELVNQAYIDADEDRRLIEHSLDISSLEMKDLYEKLEKSTHYKIKKSEQRYNKLVKALRKYYFFYAHDINGVFIYVSESVESILGYSINEFSKHYSTYLTDDKINKDISENIKYIIDGNQPKPYIISIYHKNGDICYLEVSEFPIYNENNQVIEIEGIARDVTSQYLLQRKLDYMSQHDSLTGIFNRVSLYNKLEYIIASSKRNKKYFAVLFLDLDHFKEINDTLGHDIGDLLLKNVVSRVKSYIRESDIFARIGGDEFVVILTDVDELYISNIASKIINILQKVFDIHSNNIEISTSIGISIYPKDGDSVNKLLKYADEAMYKTKNTGRNNFSYYSIEA